MDLDVVLKTFDRPDEVRVFSRTVRVGALRQHCNWTGDLPAGLALVQGREGHNPGKRIRLAAPSVVRSSALRLSTPPHRIARVWAIPH